MNIELDMNDFRLLWHTSSNTDGFDLGYARFEPIKGTAREEFNFEDTHYLYWVGENDLQALVALQLLQSENHIAGLFWDTAELNEEGASWGYCIITTFNKRG